MKGPNEDAIEWGQVVHTTVESFAVTIAGQIGPISRELMRQSMDGFEEWTTGSGLNWSGIAGSGFNIGSDMLGSALAGPAHNRFSSMLPEFLNSAFNPSAGWAIPGASRNPAVGMFAFSFGEILKWLTEPSAPDKEVSLSEEDRELPMRKELREKLLSDEDRRYIESLGDENGRRYTGYDGAARSRERTHQSGHQ